MPKFLTLFAIVFAGLTAFASLGAAAPLQESRRPDGSYQTAAWNDRVCCKRGNRDWWSTRRECNNAGGYPTANRECRDDAGGGGLGIILGINTRVCCKRGWQDWWTTWGQCKRAGGYQTANRECRDDWNNSWDQRWWGWSGGDWDRRVCCKRGNRDWWSTARECRNAFGYETLNRECRNDDHDGNWGDNDNNDWNRRVCCKRGNSDWWSTLGECRRANGYETANRECRDDNNGGYNDGGWVDPYGNPDRRVCCKRGNSDWWTTARECHSASGYETRNEECRHD